jgi:hypothetical protein
MGDLYCSETDSIGVTDTEREVSSINQYTSRSESAVSSAFTIRSTNHSSQQKFSQPTSVSRPDSGMKRPV